MELSPYNSEIIENIQLLGDKENKIELIKFINEEDKYIMHLSLNSYPVKVITDFENYCFVDSDIISLDKLNLDFINSEKKNTKSIISILKSFKINEDKEPTKSVVLNDFYHLYQKITEFSKILIDYEKLEKESKTFRDVKNIIDVSKFPKELLFNPNQIYQIIVNEIKNINQNSKHEHELVPINNNPYNLSLKLKLKNPIIERIKSVYNFDYIELNINIEPKIYPFYPPKIEFVKPSIKLPLVHNLMNLKILKMENWNPTISLEWLITTLAEKLEPVIQDYVKLEESKFMEINFLLVKLASITKENAAEKEIFTIEFNKVQNTEIVKNSADRFWKSGVGYGYSGRAQWDIGSFVKEQEIQMIELSNLLGSINSLINKECIQEVYQSILPTVLINKINGLTLLELDKSIPVFTEILNILEKLSSLEKQQDFINNIGKAFKIIADEISYLFQSTPDTQNNELYIKIHCIADWYISNTIVTAQKIVVKDLNNKVEYEDFMKPLQFDSYEIPKDHRFHSNLNHKPSSKAVMRIISEISSFKSGLPLNWDSSIWVRVSKKHMNAFSFFISGPKDTPYENGIFEFHAYFPPNYPEEVPQALIHTTGGGSVRFNPNLYACGKVCLSVLNTWNGEESEKWQPKTSTFLQVLISIQSLILGTEEPYFNEPGYEKSMHTTEGKSKSNLYNEPLLIGTIKYAIISMIKNPPDGMKDVIMKHFQLKKEEIMQTTEKWLIKCSPKTRATLEELRKEMVELFATL